jgi:hypothetical protein
MGRITRNANSYRKVYPGIRKRSILQTVIDIQIEIARVNFSNQDSCDYYFKENYNTVPSVTATPAPTGSSVGDGTEDVNVYISYINNEYVRLNTSAIFNGEMHIQVIAQSG